MIVWLALAKLKGTRKPEILGAEHTLNAAQKLILEEMDFLDTEEQERVVLSVKKFESLGVKSVNRF